MSQQNEANQAPTPNQLLNARFEAVKTVIAVAERILLNDYERQIILQSCLLSAQGLQDEYKRLNEAADPVEFDLGDDAEGEAQDAPQSDESTEDNSGEE